MAEEGNAPNAGEQSGLSPKRIEWKSLYGAEVERVRSRRGKVEASKTAVDELAASSRVRVGLIRHQPRPRIPRTWAA